MSALRMCAYGVLVLPRLRNQHGMPLKQIEPGVITERAKIIGMVIDELNADYPGWRILPFTSISLGYGSEYRRGHTSSTRWNTDSFGVLAPAIQTPFGPAQLAQQIAHKVSWREGCLTILRAVEPYNAAWV